MILSALFTLLATTSSVAATYDYNCYSFYWNGENNYEGRMTLTLNGETAQADILEERWDENLGGARNKNYRSRGETKYVKYGSELIVEEALLKGGRHLRGGGLGGFARVEGQAEGGFYQYKFICRPR